MQAVRADFNGDSKINAVDLSLLKQQFVDLPAAGEPITDNPQENETVK